MRIILSSLLSLFLIFSASAKDIHHLSDDLATYYESLLIPNSEVSCCGPGDAYWADHIDNCNKDIKREKDNCEFVAIVTDTRPDKLVLSNGKVINRIHVPIGTRIPIPPGWQRKQVIPNPTGHNILFLTSGIVAICFEPSAGS